MQSSEKIVAISKHSPWEGVSVLFAPVSLANSYQALNLLLRCVQGPKFATEMEAMGWGKEGLWCCGKIQQ